MGNFLAAFGIPVSNFPAFYEHNRERGTGDPHPTSDSNCCPLSEVIVVGTLKCVTLSNSRAEARHSAVAWFRNRLRQAGTPVNVYEQISVSLGWRLGTNNFHMIAVKRAAWRWISNQRDFKTSLNFRLLTVVKSTFSRNNFAVYIGPDQETRGLDARVPKRLKVVKDGLTHGQRHQTTRTPLGYIAKESLS